MGFMMVIGDCFGCGQRFSFNADLVPSIPVDGVRHPVCAACVALVNPIRAANGLDLIVILNGAYDPQDADW